MALVTHKYMVEHIPEEELRRTFAAREHTLDYLVEDLRHQIGARTLKSYLLTGPRGAGKSTLVRMLVLRIREDAALSAAWLPVVFPEEAPDVTSLRDLLAAMLRVMAESGIVDAGVWHARAEAEADERASRDLACRGIQEIARREGRHPILFAENIDRLLGLGERNGLDKAERQALRRILTEPDPSFLMVGTAVRAFPALERYDEALYQYFQPVPLDRLDDAQVRALLFRRAQFDGIADFPTRYAANAGSIGALSRLTGGNPRIVLMLYELVTTNAVDSIARVLAEQVDALTPLLKDILEHQMTPQQAKVFDALMRAGGTAQPRDLTAPTRLALNAITTHLTRLKEMGLVEVHGGGKGQPAFYSVPDRLLSTWYQMRYLRPNRQRIALFVDVLRVWLDESARLEALRTLDAPDRWAARESPSMAEYLAVSLKGTAHEGEARDRAVRHWLRAERLDEAAFALADLEGASPRIRDEPSRAFLRLSEWAHEHDDPKSSLQAAALATERSPDDPQAWLALARCHLRTNNHTRTLECVNRVRMRVEDLDDGTTALLLLVEGGALGQAGRTDEELAAYDELLQRFGDASEPTLRERVAQALFNRAVVLGQTGRTNEEMATYGELLRRFRDANEPTLREPVARALASLGVDLGVAGRVDEALATLDELIQRFGDAREPVIREQIAAALLNRGVALKQMGRSDDALDACDELLRRFGDAREPAFREPTARAYLNKGVALMEANRPAEAVLACDELLRRFGNADESELWESVANALAVRGSAKLFLGELEDARIDFRGALAGHALPTFFCVEVGSTLLESMDDVASWTADLETVRTALNRLPPDERADAILQLLRTLQGPAMRAQWPRVFRRLSEDQPEAVAERLRFLEPACAVLETGDRSLLHPLPPEQRDFVRELLAGFDAAAPQS